jgi:hypothetical protein
VRGRVSLTNILNLVRTHSRHDSVVTMLPRLRISCLGAQGQATKDHPREFALSRLK